MTVTMLKQTQGFPPAVYLPTGPRYASETEALVELRRTPDGRTALLAYSALDRLVNCCGDQQSWVLMRTDKLDKLHAAQPFDVAYLDLEIPATHRIG
ncbi:SAV_915 family protein [Amycolatopsis magusensis]|uniref:SAV_915 family protein n=1 Tax=Amycolatopsis magusensis TaxID=882444 RepID=UPI00379A0178|nr:hypothetical protein L3Q67_06065 [Saccharothrix sp. AJ9571]